MAQNSTSAANNSMSDNRHDTHSTTAQGGAWSTKRIATLAVMCAVGFVTSFIEIPIFPPAPWLMFDPSGIVALVAGFAFGPVTGVLVVLFTWLMHLLFSFNPYGVLMAIIALVTIVVPSSLIYRRDLTMRGAIIGMVVGAVISLVACLVANLFITPLYTPVSVQDVIAMIIPILLPFNLLKLVIECVVTVLIYKPISQAVAS